MAIKSLAHLSDLHFGASPAHERAALRLRDALIDRAVDHAVVTGDVTHRGRRAEVERFFAVFGPLIDQGRVTVVPGNHDRLGDDVGGALMAGPRVQVAGSGGVHLVRVDSTGEHNRTLWSGHGEIDDAVLADVDCAVEAAPANALVVVLLHHHPIPLPEESWGETLVTRLGWPWASELRLGAALLQILRGRCDLVLHGHRHVPHQRALFSDERRPLEIYNAGCSTSLGEFRTFFHQGGQLVVEPERLAIAV